MWIEGFETKKYDKRTRWAKIVGFKKGGGAQGRGGNTLLQNI